MQIAMDIAHGLDYIHHCPGLRSSFVHNHIKSSSVVVIVSSDDSVNAKICHFGTSELCGEIEMENEATDSENSREAETEPITTATRKNMKKSRSRPPKVEGMKGYMAPELQSRGIPTQKCDVYAFGVLILELFSGEEPLKYMSEEGTGDRYRRVSVIDTARAAVKDGDLRNSVDPKLKDSYPLDVAEKMIRVGLNCVEENPDKRPDMTQVATSVSKLFTEYQKIGMPHFSV